MKTYYSLSTCLWDILRGRVTVANVALVIASTQIKSLEDLELSVFSYISPRERDEALGYATELWNSGRIYQATVRNPNRRAFEVVRRDATYSEIAAMADPVDVPAGA